MNRVRAIVTGELQAQSIEQVGREREANCLFVTNMVYLLVDPVDASVRSVLVHIPNKHGGIRVLGVPMVGIAEGPC